MRPVESRADLFIQLEKVSWRSRLLDEFIEFSEVGREDAVLDIGSGTGEFERKIARRVGRVLGLEFSQVLTTAAIELGAKKRRRNIEFTTGESLNSLPFADEEFDLAVANSMLCLVDKPQFVLMEMGRVVKKGGRVAVVEPALEMRAERLLAYVAKKGITGPEFEALYGWLGQEHEQNRFSPADLARSFEKAGLERVQVIERMDRMVLFGKGWKP